MAPETKTDDEKDEFISGAVEDEPEGEGEPEPTEPAKEKKTESETTETVEELTQETEEELVEEVQEGLQQETVDGQGTIDEVVPAALEKEVVADIIPAAAEAVVADEVIPAAAEAKSGWVVEGGAWRYYDPTSHQLAKGQAYIPSGNNPGDERHWYYFDEATGAVTYGWKYIANQDKWVYYRPVTGTMTYGEACVPCSNNPGAAYHWYYFDDGTGATTYQWKYIAGQDKWVYYQPVTGTMTYGQACVPCSNNPGSEYHWYYFNDWTGATTYGWKYIADQDKTVYYRPVTGTMAKGWQDVGDGRTIYFNKYTGAQVTYDNGSYRAYLGILGNSSPSKYLVAIDKGSHRTVIFEGSALHWEPILDVPCSVGNDPTGIGSTEPGTWSILEKGYIMGDTTSPNGGVEYWWSKFKETADGEGQRIHSIIYRYGGGVLDGRLGYDISHGCVRLPDEGAKFIYYNCPIGTTVRVFQKA